MISSRYGVTLTNLRTVTREYLMAACGSAKGALLWDDGVRIQATREDGSVRFYAPADLRADGGSAEIEAALSQAVPS